jgi:putative flippase GtrA
VAFSCLALNAAIMTVIINIYGIQYILSQIIATAIVLLWNFGANKAWTFKQPVI